MAAKMEEKKEDSKKRPLTYEVSVTKLITLTCLISVLNFITVVFIRGTKEEIILALSIFPNTLIFALMCFGAFHAFKNGFDFESNYYHTGMMTLEDFKKMESLFKQASRYNSILTKNYNCSPMMKESFQKVATLFEAQVTHRNVCDWKRIFGTPVFSLNEEEKNFEIESKKLLADFTIKYNSFAATYNSALGPLYETNPETLPVPGTPSNATVMFPPFFPFPQSININGVGYGNQPDAKLDIPKTQYEVGKLLVELRKEIAGMKDENVNIKKALEAVLESKVVV